MQSKYTYTLLSSNTGERLVLTNAPSGWDDTNVNLVRDLTYLGVLKTITIEFAFVGEGFEFLQRHRLRYGWDLSVILRVALRSSNVFQFEGKINPVPSGSEQRKYNRFKCDVIQSAAIQKFQNREDTELNALNNLSMDQQAIVPVQPRPALFRGKMIQFYSKFDGALTDEPQIYTHVVPFNPIENGNSDVQAATGIQVDNYEPFDQYNPPSQLMGSDFAFYTNRLLEPQLIKIKWSINYTATFVGSNTIPGDVNLFWFDSYPGRIITIGEYDSDNNLVNTHFFQQTEAAFGTFALQQELSITVAPGNYLSFFNISVYRSSTIVSGGYRQQIIEMMEDDFKTEVVYNSLKLEIWQDSNVVDSIHPVVLPHELFQNLISQINGLKLHSPIFGRVELGYEEDGEFAYLATTLGQWLRGIPVEDTQLQTSLKDAFVSYSSICCLGLSISEDTVTIDRLDSLFNNEVNADIGEVEDFEVTPLTEFMFNEIKAGFPTNEYEEQNGRDEFNTATVYTNSLQSYKKALDIRSVYCGDGYGIEFSRRAGIVRTGSSDTRYDDKIFFIDLIKLEDLSLVSRRMEGIILAEGMFSPETCSNLRIYPGQNTLRWKKFLNIPLDKKPSRVLFFQSKDKNIATIIVTAIGATADGQDIELGNQAYFLPNAHNFKCPVKMTHLPGIIANPLGLTKFSYEGENFYDFLLSIDAEREKGRANWKMMGTISTPPDTSDNTIVGPFIKYGDGLDDYIKHADGTDDFIKYQD